MSARDHSTRNEDAEPQKLVVFDTTLRDGEQAPGFAMNIQEKLLLARSLSELGVDVIEAGFPAASPGDLEAVRAVARQVSGPTICGLARATRGDIEAAREALQDAEKPRIHVFLATSALHREYKLRMAKAEIVRRTSEGVALAREFCDDVEFSPEDASRTEPDFLVEVCEAAIEAGASTINVPDTVGYTTPPEFHHHFARGARTPCVRGLAARAERRAAHRLRAERPARPGVPDPRGRFELRVRLFARARCLGAARPRHPCRGVHPARGHLPVERLTQRNPAGDRDPSGARTPAPESGE